MTADNTKIQQTEMVGKMMRFCIPTTYLRAHSTSCASPHLTSPWSSLLDIQNPGYSKKLTSRVHPPSSFCVYIFWRAGARDGSIQDASLIRAGRCHGRGRVGQIAEWGDPSGDHITFKHWKLQRLLLTLPGRAGWEASQSDRKWWLLYSLKFIYFSRVTSLASCPKP